MKKGAGLLLGERITQHDKVAIKNYKKLLAIYN